MNTFLAYLDTISDTREAWKIKHKLSDIILLVLLALLANVEYWEDIQEFGEIYETALKKYLSLENGIPSHDTIQRVFSTLDPKVTAELQVKWLELQETQEGNQLKKLFHIDGKTLKGNRSKNQNALHMVSAFSKEDGICYAQVPVEEKSNEIKAIPSVLALLDLTQSVVTIDAMGTQVDIVEQIIQQKGDYCLAVKQNQHSLYRDIVDYLQDKRVQKTLKEQDDYLKTVEKAHGQLEIREYFMTECVDWLAQRHDNRWTALKSIGMVRKTIEKEEKTSIEERYYIMSFTDDIELFSRAVRQHWSIESLHWLLDVTFREDANKTLNKVAAQHLNHLRKRSLSILKTIPFRKANMSYRRKRFSISLQVEKYLDILFDL